MASEGVPFPWRWVGGMVSAILDVIWEMSVEKALKSILKVARHAQQYATRHWHSE
jgi:hypothetical protein